MSLDEQTQTVRPTRRYLFFPWIALLLVWLAFVTGIANWISTVLPLGLGQIAIKNLWSGMLLPLIGCSALWAFEFQRSSEYRGVGLILGTIWLTFFVILFQIGVAIAIADAVGSGYFRTIEGNTSPNPGTAEADRNGDGVYRKTRVLSFNRSAGLYLLGFITPPTA